ncbi:MAG: cytochrome c, partial [Gammaproteobacteria bacterium]|nr:cytochrome c [Gammaproteobacteria bacterium]
MSKSIPSGKLANLKVSMLATAVGVALSGFGISAQAAGPTLSDADFEKGKTIYFQRCAGCHGTLRKGATGKSLEPKTTKKNPDGSVEVGGTLKLGQERLEKIIRYGTEGGMNNFDDILSDEEIKLMATYIQMEPPVPPEMSI